MDKSTSGDRFGPSMCNVQCGQCKHVADIDEFASTVICGPLPPGRYQCPSCGFAWKLERIGMARVTPSGFVIPAPIEIVPVDALL